MTIKNRRNTAVRALLNDGYDVSEVYDCATCGLPVTNGCRHFHLEGWHGADAAEEEEEDASNQEGS